ncbi:DNA methyltransferase [Hyphomonas sp.]|uniref:class I SAM-dependent DNA methyltransferase n=1 Tax=Hyphomonas sp. TaxID=87 RepID=UPI00260C1308|nr:DNA methyltransferase [Hyphomonas sp.]MDF1806851.1 hypothetical protein [Hyphomonas sp.]
MRLSWNEIRARAAAFASEFADATRETSETQTFYNEFFNIFDVKRRSVGVYEKRVERLAGNTGYIDLFWPQVLLVEQKSAGRDLTAARIQAEDYFLALKEQERPRYILACDFQSFDLYDLSERTKHSFLLADLPDNVERFGFIMGVQKVAFKDQDPVNIEAAELVGNLHDRLEEAGFLGTDLEKFLVRIVFCLFADDTGVFQPRNQFLEWLEQRTADDGSDLGPKLAQLFQTLDTPEAKREAHLDEDLAAFSYVNGDLFKGATRIPAFDAAMRESLLVASRFDWSPISPAIFGSLFQSVMLPEERRATGAHYTTEKNIMKVISPLFMDGLRDEYSRARNLKRGREQALRALQEKLGSLTFFDPACGCGNFLIIAYRELRRLEIEIIRDLIDMKRDSSGQFTAEILATTLSKLDVDQFHGIEIGEFAAEIARSAMWMMDHIMNNGLSRAFGQNYARIPLSKSANIVCGDALELDWSDVIAPKHCDYVLGNPPFRGKSEMSPEQSDGLLRTVQAAGADTEVLDFVAAWFLKAGDYLNQHDRPKGCAFVATNSITQGEQVGHLWPILFNTYRLEIAFAHRTFGWGSDASGKAHVHVVIVGMEKRENARLKRLLFDYQAVDKEPEGLLVDAISPYLFNAEQMLDPKLVVSQTHQKPEQLPGTLYGSKPADGGSLLLDEQEATALIENFPETRPFVRRLIGNRDFLYNSMRSCLWLVDAPPQLIRSVPFIQERIRAVRAFRLKSKKPATRKAADYPQLFMEIRQPTTNYIAIPQHTSERREYVPFGFFSANDIAHNSCTCVPDGGVDTFAAMISAMHMCWMRYTCGRIKSDYRYANTLVYNTFPWPQLNDKVRAALTRTGQAILKARENHPGATLADLYDPDAMPPDLRKAHRENDLTVDRLYRKKPFESERDRVEFLFARYEQLRAPLIERKLSKKR